MTRIERNIVGFVYLTDADVFHVMLHVFCVILQVFRLMLHVFPVMLQETHATLQETRRIHKANIV